jgi:hypothetical protein
MNQVMVRIAMIMLFAGALIAVPALSHGDDTGATTQPTTSPSATASGPTKFYGTVTAVDTTANTFSISDQTYYVTGQTQMQKNGKAATLADAVVGEPARGTYTTDSSGKMSVTKVRFGKKSGGKSGGKKKGGATSQPSDGSGQ